MLCYDFALCGNILPCVYVPDEGDMNDNTVTQLNEHNLDHLIDDGMAQV